MNNENSCSGMLNLMLPGLGSLPPYTLAVRSLDKTPLRYGLELRQTSSKNLFDTNVAPPGNAVGPAG